MSTTEHSSDMLAAARAYAYGQQAAQLSAATTQVRERMLANTEGGDPIRVAAEELSAALLTGQPVPDDFDQNLDRLLAAEARRVARAKVLELALANLRVARDDLARSGADRALTWLGHQLAAIIATVTETEPALNGITTADQAMDAGSEAVTAWQMLTKAATGYRQIRTAQAELVAEARNDRYGAIRSIYTAGLTRTPADPGYLIATGAATPQHTMDSRTPRYIGEPWPAATDHNTPEVVPTTDVPAYLRWLAARGDAWIPTLTELTQAENQRNATIREHRINRAASAALTA